MEEGHPKTTAESTMSDSTVKIDNADDSNDVTLALGDTRVNPEHRMILAAAIHAHHL